MKKLTIELTDEAHLELLKIQLDFKQKKSAETTLVKVASKVFSEHLESLSNKKETTPLPKDS